MPKDFWLVVFLVIGVFLSAREIVSYLKYYPMDEEVENIDHEHNYQVD